VFAHVLEAYRDLEYLYFLDADIGIVNPNHLLEEYIPVSVGIGADLTFYERMFNREVMAGSYLARRSNFTIEFLLKWANYKLPESFHGWDQGAIHVRIISLCRYEIMHKL